MVGEGSSRSSDIELAGATIADQDFIAHARQDVPRLLEEVARLKARKALATETAGKVADTAINHTIDRRERP